MPPPKNTPTAAPTGSPARGPTGAPPSASTSTTKSGRGNGAGGNSKATGSTNAAGGQSKATGSTNAAGGNAKATGSTNAAGGNAKATGSTNAAGGNSVAAAALRAAVAPKTSGDAKTTAGSGSGSGSVPAKRAYLRLYSDVQVEFLVNPVGFADYQMGDLLEYIQDAAEELGMSGRVVAAVLSHEADQGKLNTGRSTWKIELRKPLISNVEQCYVLRIRTSYEVPSILPSMPAMFTKK